MSTTPTDIRPLVDVGVTERRVATFDTVAYSEEGPERRFTGHAAVFDTPSENLGGWQERILRGAFRKVLEDKPDVRFLLNHDPNLVLARTKSGTLRLSEDPTGLLVDADVVDNANGNNVRASVQRRDIDEMSFGFKVDRDNQTWAQENGVLTRTISSFDVLLDVSLATYPAYALTDASMRSLACGIEIVDNYGEVAEQALRDIAWKIHRGEQEATVEERSAIDAAFAKTDTVSPWIAQRALMATCQEPELQGVIQGKRATVVLEDVPSGEPAFRLAARQRRLRLINTRIEGAKRP